MRMSSIHKKLRFNLEGRRQGEDTYLWGYLLIALTLTFCRQIENSEAAQDTSCTTTGYSGAGVGEPGASANAFRWKPARLMPTLTSGLRCGKKRARRSPCAGRDYKRPPFEALSWHPSVGGHSAVPMRPSIVFSPSRGLFGACISPMMGLKDRSRGTVPTVAS